jgi:hypothetical protein
MNAKLFQKFNCIHESSSNEIDVADDEKQSLDQILNMSSSKLVSTTFKIDRGVNDVQYLTFQVTLYEGFEHSKKIL